MKTNMALSIALSSPDGRKRASQNMVANKMMSNINVFRTSRNSRAEFEREQAAWLSLRIGNGRGTGNFNTSKKGAKPKRFLESMSHCVVFSFRRRKSNRFLLNSRPGD
jgi:hypothetical protein